MVDTINEEDLPYRQVAASRNSTPPTRAQENGVVELVGWQEGWRCDGQWKWGRTVVSEPLCLSAAAHRTGKPDDVRMRPVYAGEPMPVTRTPSVLTVLPITINVAASPEAPRRKTP